MKYKCIILFLLCTLIADNLYSDAMGGIECYNDMSNAVENSSHRDIKRIVRSGYDLNKKMDCCPFHSDMLPLDIAKNYKTVKLLIELGAKPTEQNLIYAKNLSIFKLLIKHGADLAKATPETKAQLIRVQINRNNIDIITYLIDQKFDINILDISADSSYSPLDQAINNNRLDLVKLLYKHGGKTNYYKNFSVEQFLIKKYFTEGDYTEIKKALEEYAAHTDFADEKGNTPLHYLASNKNATHDLFILLLKNGANFYASNSREENAYNYYLIKPEQKKILVEVRDYLDTLYTLFKVLAAILIVSIIALLVKRKFIFVSVPAIILIVSAFILNARPYIFYPDQALHHENDSAQKKEDKYQEIKDLFQKSTGTCYDDSNAYELNAFGLTLYKKKEYHKAAIAFELAMDIDRYHGRSPYAINGPRYNLACMQSLIHGKKAIDNIIEHLQYSVTNKHWYQKFLKEKDFNKIRSSPKCIEFEKWVRLALAIENNSLSELKKYIPQATKKILNMKEVEYNTLLAKAALKKSPNLDIIELLLKNGADISNGYAGDNPLIFVPVYYGKLELLKLLVKYKADINARCKSSIISDDEGEASQAIPKIEEGESVAFVAVRQGNKNIIAYLVEKGADFNFDGYTAELLFHEATKKQKGVASFLTALLHKKNPVKYARTIERINETLKEAPAKM